MKAIHGDRKYGTTDEINFIRDLGQGIHSPLQGNHIQFLLLYRESLGRRDNWENLDRAVIADFLDKEIELEEGIRRGVI